MMMMMALQLTQYPYYWETDLAIRLGFKCGDKIAIVNLMKNSWLTTVFSCYCGVSSATFCTRNGIFSLLNSMISNKWFWYMAIRWIVLYVCRWEREREYRKWDWSQNNNRNEQQQQKENVWERDDNRHIAITTQIKCAHCHKQSKRTNGRSKKRLEKSHHHNIWGQRTHTKKLNHKRTKLNKQTNRQTESKERQGESETKRTHWN